MNDLQERYKEEWTISGPLVNLGYIWATVVQVTFSHVNCSIHSLAVVSISCPELEKC